ncbi:MAG: CBS domain-containing protein [Reichenbachiella sp.]
MVKSFQGVQMAKPEVLTNQPISVSDYMSSRLITFHPDQSISEVVETLLKKRISGAPVVNDRKELVGVISEGDCLKEIVKGKYLNYPMLDGTVKDHMAKNVKYIMPDVSIFEAAKMFLNLKIRRFPVLDTNMKLIGQISQKDIMRAVNSIKSENWHQ